MRFIIALCLLASPAFAEPVCGGAADMLANLSANFGETPRVRALTAQGILFVITVSPSGGWTALQVKPGGEACMVAAGEGFGIQDAEPPGDDS